MGAEQKTKGMEKEILDKEMSAKQELLRKEAELALAKAAEPPPPPPDVPPKKGNFQPIPDTPPKKGNLHP